MSVKTIDRNIYKHGNQFQVQFTVEGRTAFVGLFSTFKEAVAMRDWFKELPVHTKRTYTPQREVVTRQKKEPSLYDLAKENQRLISNHQYAVKGNK